MFVRRQFEYHPVIGFRYIPNLRARCPCEQGGYLIRTNNRGFRCDRDFVRAKKAGTRRVLLFGDSFTAGNGVSNGLRYGDLLEALVPRLEVYNFGLPGTGTDQQYLAYRQYATDLEHDLLVLAVLVENIRRVNSSAFYFQRGEDSLLPKPYYERVEGRLVLRNVPVPKEPIGRGALPAEQRRTLDRRFPRLRQLANRLGLRPFAQRLTRYQPVPEYDAPDGPGWLLMRAILERWIAESPLPVLVAPIPLYQFIEETSDPARYRRRFGELAADAGCALHDPLDDLRRYSRRERRGFRFKTDLHFTPAGHRALAESLAPVLRGMTGL